MSKYLKLIKIKDKLLLSIKEKFDKHPLFKFISIAVIILIYFLFICKTHGIKDGFIISILSWSFFVLCTPVADAGILIDFPIRLISGMKMIYSEIMVWVFAIIINFFIVINSPEIYDKTILLSLFKHILIIPYPYWGIILLSGVGTFLSVYIADSLIDKKRQGKKHLIFLVKYKIAIFIIITILIIICYKFLLGRLGVEMPLI